MINWELTADWMQVFVFSVETMVFIFWLWGDRIASREYKQTELYAAVAELHTAISLHQHEVKDLLWEQHTAYFRILRLGGRDRLQSIIPQHQMLPLLDQGRLEVLQKLLVWLDDMVER